MGFQRFVGNCSSQTKQSRAPQTARSGFIFVGTAQQEITAKTMKASTYMHTFKPCSSAVASLCEPVNNVAVGPLRGNSPSLD